MVLVQERTKLKQRIHATLAKYGTRVEASDLFGLRGNFCLKGSRSFRPKPATSPRDCCGRSRPWMRRFEPSREG